MMCAKPASNVVPSLGQEAEQGLKRVLMTGAEIVRLAAATDQRTADMKTL